jgi:polyvinyl alcohol dehydrogenase (cytochrome)
MSYALDPDQEGEVVWQYRIGQGSGLGGQWGGAVDDRRPTSASPICCRRTRRHPAVNLATGEQVVERRPQRASVRRSEPTCRASQGAPSRSSRAPCFSGSLDGGMRAYSTKDGSILWTFDTNKEFPTINGVKANGGGLEGPGAIVSGGMLYFNSGYGGFVGNGGNVLLAFGVD